jgi:hypothetical protein
MAFNLEKVGAQVGGQVEEAEGKKKPELKVVTPELSSEEKVEQLKKKREKIDSDFEDANKRLEAVEAQLEALGDDDPAKKAELEAEVEDIEVIMDKICDDLAELRAAEDDLMGVDNTVVEGGEEAGETVIDSPQAAFAAEAVAEPAAAELAVEASQEVAEAPAEAVAEQVVEAVAEPAVAESAVEAPVEAVQEKTDKEKRFEAVKAVFSGKVDAILEKMPDLNEESALNEADKKVAAPIDELTDLIGNVRPGEKATLVLRELSQRVGPSVLEFVQQIGKRLEKPGNKVDKFGRKTEVFNLKSVQELARLGMMLDDADPDFGAESSKYVLDQYVKQLAGKSPEETRNALFAENDNRALYLAFDTIIKRLGRGEELPEGLKLTVKQLLPILKASDQVDPKKPGYAESSRFLTDAFLVRNQDVRGSESKFLENIHEALQKLI